MDNAKQIEYRFSLLPILDEMIAVYTKNLNWKYVLRFVIFQTFLRTNDNDVGDLDL